MANTIIIKKSSTAGAVPTAASLQPGELAVNLADRKLYSKTTGGSVVELGSGTVAAHTHVIADVTGLQTALDGKLGSTANAVSASKLQTARTISLGGDLTGSASFDGSANVAISAQVADNSHQHTIANVTGLQGTLDTIQFATNVPQTTLSVPNLEMKTLFPGIFTNRTAFHPLTHVWFEVSTDGTNWTDAGLSDTVKKRIMGGDTLSSWTIPHSTAFFRVRLRAPSYVFLNHLFMYHSTQGNTMTLAIKVKKDGGSWAPYGSATGSISSWPGYTSLQVANIAFHPSNATGSFYNEVAVEMTPTWSHATNGILLTNFQFWGPYPFGAAEPYTVDQDKNFTFPAGVTAVGPVNATGGNITGGTLTNGTLSGVTTYATLNAAAANSRDKLRVWGGSSAYAIGMSNAFTFGDLGGDGYAMTFQMSAEAQRGFWWGTSSHTTAQGAMSLSNRGRLTVAESVRVGYGTTDATDHDTGFDLDIQGPARVQGVDLVSTLNAKAPIASPSFTTAVNSPRYNVGDDAYFADINAANTVAVRGSQNADVGYINFGNGGNALGSGVGVPLTFRSGGVAHHGSSTHGSAKITVSTAAPSGGSSGDIWFKV